MNPNLNSNLKNNNDWLQPTQHHLLFSTSTSTYTYLPTYTNFKIVFLRNTDFQEQQRAESIYRPTNHLDAVILLCCIYNPEDSQTRIQAYLSIHSAGRTRYTLRNAVRY